MIWFVYILECKSPKNKITYYTGITTNLEKRFEKHSKGTGAKYTKINKPVRFVYTEQCKNRSEASQKEYKIKQLSRNKKKKLADI